MSIHISASNGLPNPRLRTASGELAFPLKRGKPLQLDEIPKACIIPSVDAGWSSGSSLGS